MRELSRHRWLWYGLAIAVLLRLGVFLGFAPLWFDDSFEYVGVAQRMQPYPVRPSGYSFLLSLLEPLHSFAAVTVLQHLLGLGTGVLVYALIRRRLPRVPGWAAALAGAPVLLDAQQIFFEHAVLSDLLFSFLVTAAVVAALWEKRLSVRGALLVGVLLAGATLTRSIGLALLVLFAAHLLLSRPGWRPVLAMAAAVAVPLGSYAVWYGTAHGTPALSGGSGVWLWARAAPFMDCDRLSPPPDEAALCPRQALQDRPSSPHFIWSSWSPLRDLPGRPVANRADLFSPDRSAPAGSLAWRAIANQPGDYATTVLHDMRKLMNWRRGPNPQSERQITFNRYAFPNVRRPLPADTRIDGGTIAEDLRAYDRAEVRVDFTEPFATAMRAYQRYAFIPGPILVVSMLLASVGTVVAMAVRRWRPAAWVAALPLAGGLTLVVAPVLITAYDSRYLLPALPLFGVALVASFATILDRRTPQADAPGR